MTDQKFKSSEYSASIQIGAAEIKVDKRKDTEWSTVTTKSFNSVIHEIEIPNKELAEHLHFMLGQMLSQ